MKMLLVLILMISSFTVRAIPFSGLDPITGANLETTDLFVMADLSETLNKKLTVSEMRLGMIQDSLETSSNLWSASKIVTEIGATAGTATELLFTPQAAPTHAEGILWYDSTTKSLSYYNEESDVKVDLGQELLVRVKNVTASTIPNGSAVYQSGATGGFPTIELAKADVSPTAGGVGLATQDILAGQFGYVTISGMVRGLDTSSFSAGDVLYLSDSVAGSYTTTRPLHPSIAIRVGRVIISDASIGIIFSARGQEFGTNFTSSAIYFANGGGPDEDPTNFSYDDINNTLNVNNIAVGASGTTADIDSTGHLTHYGSYGSAYEHNEVTPTTVTVVTAGTYYGWVSASEHLLAGAGYVTFLDNSTADRIIIGANGAGLYKVTAYVSFNGDNTHTAKMAAFKNGVIATTLDTSRGLGTSPPVGSASFGGLINLVENDYLDIRFTSDVSGKNLYIYHISFIVERISK